LSIYQNAANPCMPLRQLHDLLPQLDGTLNLSITIRLILRDFNTGIHGVLSYADFVVWWEAHKSVERKKILSEEVEVRGIEPNTIVGINSPDAMHLVGFIDSTAHRDTLRSAFITHLRLPPSDSVFDNINMPVIDEVSDWNDAFQSSAERVDMLSEVFLTTTVEQGVFEVENEEEKCSVDGQSEYSQHTGINSGVHTHSSHTTNTHHTTHTHTTHTTHTTNNTHTNTHSTHTTYTSHPTQVSRSTNRTITGALPPALGGSRNTIAYPDVVSRDGYIVPIVPSAAQARGGVVYSGDSVSGVSNASGSVISQSLASHVYSKDSIRSDNSHTHSQQSRSVRSSIHSALSHASHLFHHTQNNKHNHSNHNLHTLPPLPEGSYQSDETKSERSFDTRNTEEIHADSLNEHDEYHNSNSVNNGSEGSGMGGGFGNNSDNSDNNDGNRGVKSVEEQWTELVEACVHVSAVKGAFYRTAIDGKLI